MGAKAEALVLLCIDGDCAMEVSTVRPGGGAGERAPSAASFAARAAACPATPVSVRSALMTPIICSANRRSFARLPSMVACILATRACCRSQYLRSTSDSSTRCRDSAAYSRHSSSSVSPESPACDRPRSRRPNSRNVMSSSACIRAACTGDVSHGAAPPGAVPAGGASVPSSAVNSDRHCWYHASSARMSCRCSRVEWSAWVVVGANIQSALYMSNGGHAPRSARLAAAATDA